jgi:hypothetical protein
MAQPDLFEDENATGVFKEGDLIASFKAKGLPIRRQIVAIDKTLTLLTRADLKKARDWIRFNLLADPETGPDERRELLADLDTCPCCQRWLGHNQPPADDGEP